MMGTPATEVDRLLQAARLHLAHGELHETVERAAEAIRLEGGRSDAYLLRAEALRRLKKPERALADLAVAIRLAPDRPGPYIVRAEILKRRNVFDQAVADATHALILDPHNASALSVRAQCRHAIGDQEGADDDFRAMLEIDPTRPVPNLGAGPRPWGSASAMESDEERFWKRTRDGGRSEDRTILAGGGPVDEIYRSRPAVSDEEAPVVLGTASGYKPEVLVRPITRRRGRTMRSPGHRGGLVPILGVAVVVGCGLWLAFRGPAGTVTDAGAIEPQSPRLARSKAPQLPPAVIEHDAAGAKKVASAPAEPLDLDPVVKDLGSFTLSKAGRAWEVVMPDRFTKAEAVFYRGDPSDRTLNAAWEGRLQINGKDVVRFRGSPRRGIFLFHDSTTGTDYEEVNDYERRQPERLLDVTAYLHPGENSFYYYHEQRPDLPMGLVLSITGGGAPVRHATNSTASTNAGAVVDTQPAGSPP
jgi:tetratricopeptide (TPR) repeat protein